MVTKLHVGNLPQSATQESLEKIFGTCGIVHSVSIIKDRDTGQSKNFAFVEMLHESEAQESIEELDGTLMDNREIMVKEAKPMPNGVAASSGRSYRDRS